MVETIDTPDMVDMVSNIQYNLNLLTFLLEFLLGVAFVFFLCYVLYRFFVNCSS